MKWYLDHRFIFAVIPLEGNQEPLYLELDTRKYGRLNTGYLRNTNVFKIKKPPTSLIQLMLGQSSVDDYITSLAK